METPPKRCHINLGIAAACCDVLGVLRTLNVVEVLETTVKAQVGANVRRPAEHGRGSGAGSVHVQMAGLPPGCACTCRQEALESADTHAHLPRCSMLSAPLAFIALGSRGSTADCGTGEVLQVLEDQGVHALTCATTLLQVANIAFDPFRQALIPIRVAPASDRGVVRTGSTAPSIMRSPSRAASSETCFLL